MKRDSDQPCTLFPRVYDSILYDILSSATENSHIKVTRSLRSVKIIPPFSMCK